MLKKLLQFLQYDECVALFVDVPRQTIYIERQVKLEAKTLPVISLPRKQEPPGRRF